MKVPDEYFKLSELISTGMAYNPSASKWWEVVAGFISAQQRELERLKGELRFAAEALETWESCIDGYYMTPEVQQEFDADLERVKKAAE